MEDGGQRTPVLAHVAGSASPPPPYVETPTSPDEYRDMLFGKTGLELTEKWDQGVAYIALHEEWARAELQRECRADLQKAYFAVQRRISGVSACREGDSAPRPCTTSLGPDEGPFAPPPSPRVALLGSDGSVLETPPVDIPIGKLVLWLASRGIDILARKSGGKWGPVSGVEFRDSPSFEDLPVSAPGSPLHRTATAEGRRSEASRASFCIRTAKDQAAELQRIKRTRHLFLSYSVQLQRLLQGKTATPLIFGLGSSQPKVPARGAKLVRDQDGRLLFIDVLSVGEDIPSAALLVVSAAVMSWAVAPPPPPTPQHTGKGRAKRASVSPPRATPAVDISKIRDVQPVPNKRLKMCQLNRSLNSQARSGGLLAPQPQETVRSLAHEGEAIVALIHGRKPPKLKCRKDLPPESSVRRETARTIASSVATPPREDLPCSDQSPDDEAPCVRKVKSFHIRLRHHPSTGKPRPAPESPPPQGVCPDMPYPAEAPSHTHPKHTPSRSTHPPWVESRSCRKTGYSHFHSHLAARLGHSDPAVVIPRAKAHLTQLNERINLDNTGRAREKARRDEQNKFSFLATLNHMADMEKIHRNTSHDQSFSRPQRFPKLQQTKEGTARRVERKRRMFQEPLSPAPSVPALSDAISPPSQPSFPVLPHSHTSLRRECEEGGSTRGCRTPAQQLPPFFRPSTADADSKVRSVSSLLHSRFRCDEGELGGDVLAGAGNRWEIGTGAATKADAMAVRNTQKQVMSGNEDLQATLTYWDRYNAYAASVKKSTVRSRLDPSIPPPVY